MLKRIISVILTLTLIGIPVFGASQFADLSETHWGYASVSKLVADGSEGINSLTLSNAIHLSAFLDKEIEFQ